MYKYALVALFFLASPNLATAGSGKTGSVKVDNVSTTTTTLVAIDPSSSLLNSTTLSQFKSRGGRVINAGGSTTFKNVKVGNHTIVTAQVTSSTTSISRSSFSSSIISVSKGVTTTISSGGSSSSSGN